MAFNPKHIDYKLSPYTGLTRESWIEAGEYMLQGIFQHIKNIDSPVVVPRQETKITYPHADAPEDIKRAEERAEVFEGLTRSFFIAAPLIHNNPELKLNGYVAKEYYKRHVLAVCTKEHPLYVGDYEALQEMTGHKDLYRAFQQTVETCALVIGLWASKEEIWDTYTKAEKDIVAAFLSSFAHANTVPQNWRLFNMLDLAFLYQEGYEIDKEIMADHAQAILDYYVGDGWYRDGQSFDYYSCWAFNFYAPLWNEWYGYENEPFLAAKFEKYSNELMKTYPDFFDEDGFTNMWGRSGIYRFAATSPLEGNFLLQNPTVNPGRARRVASGSLMQFLGREDFIQNGIPTMGFYSQFAPLVQGYSCAESPFWMGKAFLCLHLPKEHPFWTATEQNGSWETMKKDDVKETTLNGPALCFTNHKANRATILRSAKVVKNIGDVHGMWNYSKLTFHSKYPWEATPKTIAEDAINEGEVESQQYVLKDLTSGQTSLCNATFWGGEQNGILYRRQYFDYRLTTETHWMQGLFLADMPVSNGILRVDKMKLFKRPITLTLGSYGFPDNGTKVQRLEDGNAKAIILQGTDAQGKVKQMAMTIYDGWDSIDLVHSSGTNPDSRNSIVIYASATKKKQYGGHESYILISQVITKDSEETFTREELFPIEKIQYTDMAGCGTFGPIELVLKDGRIRTVDYEEVEGRLSL